MVGDSWLLAFVLSWLSVLRVCIIVVVWVVNLFVATLDAYELCWISASLLFTSWFVDLGPPLSDPESLECCR